MTRLPSVFLTTMLLAACGGAGPDVVLDQPGVYVVEQRPWDTVLVLQTDDIACPAEVVGLVDVHASAPGLEFALDELRRRAFDLGASAVLGVEYHHGHGDEDEPLHLSGLGVRCAPAAI